MDHSPTQLESGFLSSIADLSGADLAFVRLTDTMLIKSIIDAHAVIRFILKDRSIIDFAALGQGQEQKIQLPISLVSSTGVNERTVSFYRPVTKKGDPRIWISGLKSIASSGSLLVIGVVNSRLFSIVVDSAHDQLRAHLLAFLSDAAPANKQFEYDVADLTTALKRVAEQGWIRAIGTGAPTVGETLEAELGIARNSFRTPDFRGRIEIKSARIGGSGLQTLFSQIPVWQPPVLGTRDLVLAHGVFNTNKNRHEIYCTITTTRNTLGWKLKVDVASDEIIADHSRSPVLHFPLERLREAFEAKHGASVFVKASSRKGAAGEEFKYEGAILRVRGSFPRFLAELEDARAGLDLVANVTDGKARDHGYLWRVRRDRIPALFAYERKLI
jgi:hypothetical protein